MLNLDLNLKLFTTFDMKFQVVVFLFDISVHPQLPNTKSSQIIRYC